MRRHVTARSDRQAKVCKRAGLVAGRQGFTLHVLRHGYATLGAAANVPLDALGKALGHSHQGMTAKYVNTHAEAARAAADAVGARLAKLLEG